MTLHDAEAPPAGEPTPSPRPRGMLGRRLAFREPSPEEMEELLGPRIPNPGESQETTGEELPGEAPGFDSAGPPSGDPDPSDRAETGEERSGTRASKKTIFASEESKRLARNGVLLVGSRAHEWFARTEGQIRAGLYLADEEDAENIGDPLANIAARRTGISSDNPDVNDAIAGLIGFGNYLVKQFVRATVAARVDREAAPPQVIPGEVAG